MVENGCETNWNWHFFNVWKQNHNIENESGRFGIFLFCFHPYSQQLLRKGHLVLHQVVYVLANIKSDKSSAATSSNPSQEQMDAQKYHS
jgi:hypothetical protein